MDPCGCAERPDLNRNHWLWSPERQRKSLWIGAKIEVRQRGRKLVRRAHTDSSYLSAHDIRVHFGLGADATIDGLIVYWPDGRTEAWDSIQADRIMTIRQGTGRNVRG
jgi:hypothetical protein